MSDDKKRIEELERELYQIKQAFERADEVMKDAVRSAILRERAACIDIVESFGRDAAHEEFSWAANDIAAKIRSRP